METGVVSSLIQQANRKKRIKPKQFISVQLQWLSLLLNRENLCDPGLSNCHITDYPNMKVLEHQQSFFFFFLLTNLFRAQGDSSSLLHATWLGTFKMVSSHGWHVSVCWLKAQTGCRCRTLVPPRVSLFMGCLHFLITWMQGFRMSLLTEQGRSACVFAT